MMDWRRAKPSEACMRSLKSTTRTANSAQIHECTELIQSRYSSAVPPTADRCKVQCYVKSATKDNVSEAIATDCQICASIWIS